MATTHGYRSCWSTPILSHQGAVLGTFAMYSTTVREPTAAETRLIDVATRIAGIAIERKQSEDRIHFLANHDALTGLPNRALLKDRLSQAMLYAQRYDRWVTVVFVDLDNFKFVNDSLGHNAGDELLKTVASRMVDCVGRPTRWCGLAAMNSSFFFSISPRARTSSRRPFRNSGRPSPSRSMSKDMIFRVTSSIGIANYPNDGTDADALLANADAAMYRAKEIGRDNFQFYTPAFEHQGARKIPAAGGVAKRRRPLRVRPALPAAGRPAYRARFSRSKR